MGQVAPVRPGAVLCRAHAGASVRAGPGPREHRTRQSVPAHQLLWWSWGNAETVQVVTSSVLAFSRRDTKAARAIRSRLQAVGVPAGEPRSLPPHRRRGQELPYRVRESLTETRRPAAVSPRRWSAGRRRVQARRAQDPRVPAVACGRSAGSPPARLNANADPGQRVPAPGTASAGMAGALYCSRHGPDNPRPRLVLCGAHRRRSRGPAFG